MIHAEPKTATRATGGQAVENIGSMLSDAALTVLQGKQAEIAGRISAREKRLGEIPAELQALAQALSGQAQAQKSALREELQAKYDAAAAAGRPDDMLVYKSRLIALL